MFSTRARKVITSIVICLPLVVVFVFVCKFGILIPSGDQWALVPMLEKLHNNTLTSADLWSQHNEHRILFPRILMLILAHLSNWNIFLELCANMVLATCTFLFFLSILRSTSETAPLWLKVLVSMVIFSMAQSWTWGWQLAIFLSILGSVIAIWAANKWQGKSFGLIIIILAAVLSSYSFIAGLLTWPAVLVILLLQKNWKLKHVIILTLACIATVLLYYNNYAKSPHHPSLSFFFSHPLVFIKYVLAFLGAPLGSSASFALVMGLIMVVLSLLAIFNIWRLNKQKLRDLAPWLALALYVCLAACATGVGRSGFGWRQAFDMRYNTISVLMPIATAILLYHSIRLSPAANKKNLLNNRFLIIAVTAIFLVSYAKSYYRGMRETKTISRFINASAFCLTDPQTADDGSLKRLYPNPEVIRRRIETLSELGIKFETAK